MAELFDDPELIATVRRYLPPSLAERFPHDFGLEPATLGVQHLSALLHTLSTYLPRYLVQAQLADAVPGRVTGAFQYGTTMFADVSGFTAMSERLTQLSPEEEARLSAIEAQAKRAEKLKSGAEEIISIVNPYFTTMLDITGRYGGDLLKFGGDALLVFFGGPGHAARAGRAALQMQRAMAAFARTETSQGTFPLRMSIGMGTGPIFLANLGTAENMEYTVMGRGLTHTARAEDVAEAGEIFIDDETLEAVRDLARVGEGRGGFHNLLEMAGRPEAPEAERVPTEETADAPPATALGEDALLAQMAGLARQIRIVEPFLPPGLLEKIVPNPQQVEIEGGFRLVTVVFANFYGVEEIIECLGPERADEVTAILNRHFTTMQGIIHKYGGIVNKVDSYAIGHRIMALFGALKSWGNDAQLAVLAALEMQEAMEDLATVSTSRGDFPLKQRIGINTGHVFAGNVGSAVRREYTVMGDEVNLTARLMAVAGEGQLLVSHSTVRQTEGMFALHELEPVRVKGKSEPVRNYEVLGVGGEARKVEQPLVGREQELATCLAAVEQVWAGRGQVLAVIGEAGVGKTRLVEELVRQCRQRGMGVLSSACVSYGQNMPYLPWIEVMRAYFDLREDDSAEVRGQKITAGLGDVDEEMVVWAPVVGEMMGVPLPENDLTALLDAKLRQQRLFSIVLQLLRHRAEASPLLVVIDDAYWIDSISLDLLNYVARNVAGSPILLIVIYRTKEDLIGFGELPHRTEIDLAELSDEASYTLAASMLDMETLPEGLQRLVDEKVQGNPLYVEEIIRSLIDLKAIRRDRAGRWQVTADLSTVAIPDTIHGLVMSRIDLLDESSRRVLQVASVVGRSFAYRVLEGVYPYGDLNGHLRGRLGELTRLELIALNKPQPELEYTFHHIMTQEVAYESLLFARRRELHRRIGEYVEQSYAANLAEHYGLLAHHYYEGQVWDKALEYAVRAGDKARAEYANQAAIAYYRQALEVAGQEGVAIPPDQQAALHESLADVQEVVGEYDPALEHYAQARALVERSPLPEADRRVADLCRKTAAVYERKSDYEATFEWLEKGLAVLGDENSGEAARIYLLGGGAFYRQGKLPQALEWCERSLEISTRLGTQQETAHGYYLLAEIYRRYGDNARAVEFCRRSLEIYDEIGDVLGEGQARNTLANAYFDQGDWMAATTHYQRGLEIKEKIGDIYGQGMIANNLAGVFLNQGELDKANELYERSLHIWEEIGSTYGAALLYNNLAMVSLGRKEWSAAASLLGESLKLFEKIQVEDFLPEVHRHRAEAHLGLGEVGEAARLAQRSLALATKHQMKIEEGAVRRVLGQVHLALGDHVRAEEELTASLQILEELNSQYETGKTLFQLALLHRRQGREKQAQDELSRAMAIFERLGARLDLEEARGEWARVAAAFRNGEAGLRY